jgi:hypothetical protein
MTNLSVVDGKLRASAADSLVFKTSTKTHIIHLMSNYLGVYSYLVGKLRGSHGARELEALLDKIQEERILDMSSIVRDLNAIDLRGTEVSLRLGFQIDIQKLIAS